MAYINENKVFTVVRTEHILSVDDELSMVSENPVQNKVVTNALNGKVDKVGNLKDTRNLCSIKDVSGTSYKFVALEKPLQAGTYTVSAVVTSEAAVVTSLLRFTDDNGDDYGNVTVSNRGGANRVSAVVTLSDIVTHILFFAGYNTSTSTGYNFTFNDIQIESGNYASDFVPFKSLYDVDLQEKYKNTKVIGRRYVNKRASMYGSSGSASYIALGLVPSVKKNERLVFNANLTVLGTLSFGFYKTSLNDLKTRVTIDGTNLTYIDNNENPTSYPHGLTIANNLTILIESNSSGGASCSIISNGVIFKQNINWYRQGLLYLYARGTSATNMTNVTIEWTCADLDKKFFMFGDSYFSYTDRWYKYFYQYGYSNNALMNAFSGENSSQGLQDLQSLLVLHKPQTIVWCLGMNDGSDDGTPSTSWLSAINNLIDLCKKYDIELVLSTIPTVPSISHEYKNAWVKTSGYRYIDFANAVGSQADGTWYAGMLSSDNVHPTDKGAKALFGQVLTDVPELMIDND